MKLYIGEQLKSLRKEKHITQEQLAEVLGVSYQSVSRWELGVCYPDMELLPALANYFGVTIDQLLSNDISSKEADKKRFYNTVNTFERGSLKQMQFVEDYCSKYPENDRYAFILQDIMTNYIIRNEDKKAAYMPKIVSLFERLNETCYREDSLRNIITVCEEEELEKWLELCSWSANWTRRGCLVSRYNVHSDWKNVHIQQGIENFENMALQLDRRFPDMFGPTRKAEYHRAILKIIASFGDGINPPDGWALYYAYKQFVLAACLFGDGKAEDGWIEFNAAFATYRRIFGMKEEWLPLGNAIFSELKIRKDYFAIMDADGREYTIYASQYTEFARAGFLYNFLTDLRWAWFDCVRSTKQYLEAVEWAKNAMEREENIQRNEG